MLVVRAWRYDCVVMVIDFSEGALLEWSNFMLLFVVEILSSMLV